VSATTTTVSEREERDEAILHERIAGVKLVEIGERHGLTAEGVRYVYARAADAHVRGVIADMHGAQRKGGALLVAMRGKTTEEMREAARFGAWLLDRLGDPKYGVDAEVRLIEVSGSGVLISLRDKRFAPNTNSIPEEDH
jgi:hypothetical protein